jgi:stage V sporulation protein G
MNITKVQIHLIRPDPTNKLKAYADIIFEEVFIVRGLTIKEDHEGYTEVYMPNKYRKTPTGDVRCDIAHPLNEKYRGYIRDTVLDAYEDTMGNTGSTLK